MKKKSQGGTILPVPAVSKSSKPATTKTEAIEAAIAALALFSPTIICSYANIIPKTQLEFRDCTDYKEMLAEAKTVLPGKATVSSSKDVEKGHFVGVRYDGKTIAIIVTKQIVSSSILLTVETTKLFLMPKHLTNHVAPATKVKATAKKEVLELATT